MKKLSLLFGVVILVIGVFLFITQDKSKIILGASYTTQSVNLVGSSADLKALPKQYVFANATTTNAAVDGAAVTQLVSTGGMETVRLNISGVGKYATNTLEVRPMFSQDGTNFFDALYATSTMPYSTSTVNVVPSVASFLFPTATTSISFDFNVKGSNFTRFLFLSADPDNDNKEGVQAWITAILLEPLSR